MSGTAIKGESIKLNEKEIGKITSAHGHRQVCGVGMCASTIMKMDQAI